MFTRKEHSFFNDPYFKIVREEQQYIEVQSVSTGHCWNVFKNQFEPTCKVKLYHKHLMRTIALSFLMAVIGTTSEMQARMLVLLLQRL